MMHLKINDSVYVTQNNFCTGGKGIIDKIDTHDGIEGFYIQNVPNCFWHWKDLKDMQHELEEFYKDKRAYDPSKPPVSEIVIPENFGFNKDRKSEYGIIQYK